MTYKQELRKLYIELGHFVKLGVHRWYGYKDGLLWVSTRQTQKEFNDFFKPVVSAKDIPLTSYRLVLLDMEKDEVNNQIILRPSQ